MTTSGSPLDIEQQLEATGKELTLALAELLEPLAGVDPKPADIGEVLELDRTQAWRLARVIATSDPYEALYETPAPKGLSLIVDAAERAGAPSVATKRMRKAIATFAGLLHEFPDGREGLYGALASRVPRAQEATLKAAKKKIAQGMGQLMGLRSAVRYVASVLVPSEGFDNLADVVAVAGYKELRRVRSGPPPVVFSGRTYTRSEDASAPAIDALDGSTDPDPRMRLLEEFSELTPDALKLEELGEERRLVLAPDQPPINSPITMFFAQRIARSLERTPTGASRHELVHNVPLLPSDVSVFDILIHKDLYPEADPPRVTVERFGFNPAQQVTRPEDTAFRIEEPGDPKAIRHGVSRSTLRAVPFVPELLESVFKRIGEDPKDYRMYRTTLEIVPPGFAVVFWVELPSGEE